MQNHVLYANTVRDVSRATIGPPAKRFLNAYWVTIVVFVSAHNVVRGSRKFVRAGPTLITFNYYFLFLFIFFSMRGER